MSRERLLIVTPSLGGGGAEHHLVRLLPRLTEHFDVHLATLKDDDTLVTHVPSSVTLHRIRSLRWLVGARRLRRLARQLKPRMTFAVQEAASVPWLLARATLPRAARPVTLLSVQTTLSVVLARSRRRTRFLLGQAIRRLYPQAEGVVATSQGVADEVTSMSPRLRGRVTVVANASVESTVLTRAAEPCDHPFFHEATIPVLVACGRLTAPKDYPTLLAAVARIAVERPVRLIVLGDGPLAGDLRTRAGTLGITDIVSFPGYVANPYAFLSRATVFVLSSRWEGFGNVIAEALACGAPVISTDCPYGPAEILDHGVYGRLVPPADPVALADAVLALVADGAALRDLAARGPGRAELFSVDRSSEAHVRLLKGLGR